MTYIQGIIEIERPIIANNQMKLMKERRPHVLAMTPQYWSCSWIVYLIERASAKETLTLPVMLVNCYRDISMAVQLFFSYPSWRAYNTPPISNDSRRDFGRMGNTLFQEMLNILAIPKRGIMRGWKYWDTNSGLRNKSQLIMRKNTGINHHLININVSFLFLRGVTSPLNIMSF